jgi:hypothetical protein
MQQNSKQSAFELGQIVATPGALAALKKARQQAGEFLTRHVNGIRFPCGPGRSVWATATEADRSLTIM